MTVVSAEMIDSFREGESLNMLEAEHFASLIERLSPDKVFVDAADVVEARFGAMIQAHMTGVDLL